MKALFLLLLLHVSHFTFAQTTTWDGVMWSNGAPNIATDVIITENKMITVKTNIDNFGDFTIEDKYAIQALPELQDNINEEVPLGFEVTMAGTYSISIFQEYIDPEFDIILDDTQENVQTNLRLSDYVFNLSSPAEINDRFILRYNYNVVLGISDKLESYAKVRAYFDHDVLVSSMGNNSRPNNLEILNINEQIIMKETYTDRVSTRNLPIGIYLVRYYFDDHVITEKLLKTNN